jgi:hypothetical protein
MRGGGQFRKITSARGSVDLLLCLNRCFAEFRQKRIYGRVLAEPIAKHVPVDCRGGLPLVWVIDAALSPNW